MDLELDEKDNYISKINNPKHVGPGVWFSIHLLAFKSNTLSEKRYFAKFIKDISHTFKCKTCRDHINEYISKYPVESSFNLRDGVFGWSVRFHNNANRFLKKPQLTVEEARGIYLPAIDSETEICSDCGEDHLGTEKSELFERKVPTSSFLKNQETSLSSLLQKFNKIKA